MTLEPEKTCEFGVLFQRFEAQEGAEVFAASLALESKACKDREAVLSA